MRGPYKFQQPPFLPFWDGTPGTFWPPCISHGFQYHKTHSSIHLVNSYAFSVLINNFAIMKLYLLSPLGSSSAMLHLPLSSYITVSYIHQRRLSPSSIPIFHHHRPSPSSIIITHHHFPSPFSITIFHHHLPSPSSIIITHHHHPSPSSITIVHHHLPSSSPITIPNFSVQW